MDALRLGLARGIEVRRRMLGMSVAALAGASGISRATINAALASTTGVRLRTVACIAMACMCEPHELLIGDAHVGPPHTRSDDPDLVRVMARNVTALSHRRGFANVESLARAAGIARSQLYVILEAKCDPSIDRLGELAVPLSCAPHELLRPPAQLFPES